MKSETNHTNWFIRTRESTRRVSGQLRAMDQLGHPIIMEWEEINPLSSHLSEKIKDLNMNLVEAYAKIELEFARQFPESVPHEMFLKSLEPLFKNGVNTVDWKVAEEQIRSLLEQFFLTTDWAKYSVENELHFFVVASDQKTGKRLGVIQFLIMPEYSVGDVKVALYDGVMPVEEQRRIDELLMSSIFKIIPSTRRVFFHTRITNEFAIQRHRELGFQQFSGPLKNWIDLEYLSEQSERLQKRAETIIEHLI